MRLGYLKYIDRLMERLFVEYCLIMNHQGGLSLLQEK